MHYQRQVADTKKKKLQYEKKGAHEAASLALYAIKDRAFDLVTHRMHGGDPVTEFEVQDAMAGWFEEAGLISDSRPVVAAQENAGDPHYLPTRDRHRVIGSGEVLLLDLWGKLPMPRAVYADITWPRLRAARPRMPTPCAANSMTSWKCCRRTGPVPS